jgi:hypothetical protein
VVQTPYQHIYVTSVFEPRFYKCMMANLPYEYQPEEYTFEKKRQMFPLGFSRVGDVRKDVQAYGDVLDTEWCVHMLLLRGEVSGLAGCVVGTRPAVGRHQLSRGSLLPAYCWTMGLYRIGK